jgi:hypothetical protein
LFVTGRDGQVMSTWWEGGKGWQKWFAIGPARNAASGQTVTAQWSNPNHLDLFITGADGTVKSTFWEANPPPPLRATCRTSLSLSGDRSAA